MPIDAGDIDRGGDALGLAVVDRLELGELVGMRFEQIGELVDHHLARDRRQAGPAAVVEGGAGGGDGAVDVRVGGVDEAADLAPGRGIDRPAASCRRSNPPIRR